MYATVRNPWSPQGVCNLMQALSADRFRLVLAAASLRIWRRSDHRRLPLTPGGFHFIDAPSMGGRDGEYQGVLGNFPALQLTDRHLGPPPPIVLTAIGQKRCSSRRTLRWSAAASLHLSSGSTQFGQNGLRCGGEAGRDPRSVRIYHNVIVAPDLSRTKKRRWWAGRAITYFQVPATAK